MYYCSGFLKITYCKKNTALLLLSEVFFKLNCHYFFWCATQTSEVLLSEFEHASSHPEKKLGSMRSLFLWATFTNIWAKNLFCFSYLAKYSIYWWWGIKQYIKILRISLHTLFSNDLYAANTFCLLLKLLQYFLCGWLLYSFSQTITLMLPWKYLFVVRFTRITLTQSGLLLVYSSYYWC